MKKFIIKFFEWDMNNGEYLYRDYNGEEIHARDLDELYEMLDRRLTRLAKRVKKDGWECEQYQSGEMICVKDYHERLIGYDVEEGGE